MGVIYMMTTIKNNTELWQEVYDTHAESLRGGQQHTYVIGFYYFLNGQYRGWRLFSNHMSQQIAGLIYQFAVNNGVRFGQWTNK